MNTLFRLCGVEVAIAPDDLGRFVQVPGVPGCEDCISIRMDHHVVHSGFVAWIRFASSIDGRGWGKTPQEAVDNAIGSIELPVSSVFSAIARHKLKSHS